MWCFTACRIKTQERIWSVSAERISWKSVSSVHAVQHKVKSTVSGEEQPMHQYLLKANHLKSSLIEKDPGILVDTKLNTSQQVALATKKIARIFWAAIGKVLPAG